MINLWKSKLIVDYFRCVRNHPLAKHSDILTCIETRISMLSMTYTSILRWICAASSQERWIISDFTIDAFRVFQMIRLKSLTFSYLPENIQGDRWGSTCTQYNNAYETERQSNRGVHTVGSTVAYTWSITRIERYFIHGHWSLRGKNRSNVEKGLLWIAN